MGLPSDISGCDLRMVIAEVPGDELPRVELASFKDALQLRYNAAQRLFNGDD